MKIKRHIGVPAALLLYLIAIGIYTWPGHNPDVTYTQWGGVVGITLACIVALYFLFKKRDKNREKMGK